MKKRILSLLCALCLLLACAPSAPALEGEAQRAADTLITLGLLDDTKYDLSAPVDRVTATTMLVLLSGGVTNGGKSERLRDVPQASSDAVSYAVRQGWVKAASDAAFGAGQNVMANDWFSMLLSMLGYKDFTPSEAATYARRVGLISRAYTGLVTFGDLCESALDVLRFRYPDGDAVVERLVKRELCKASAVNALGLNRQSLTAREIADRYMSAAFSLALYDTEDAILADEISADASGFFISADGLAVTNYHSIDGSIQAVATLVTGESFPVERVVWYDVGKDLAVIRVSRTTLDNRQISRFATLELVGTTDLRPGDIAYTLSNPLGLGLAVSEGVISATARKVERYELPCVMSTADISQGSSGGALLNAFGRVVAVTSGAYRVGNSMYLAVPVDIFKTLDLSGTGLTLAQVAAKEAEAQTQQKPSAPEEEEPEAIRGRF